MEFNINYFSLKDKVAIITGANMGLGLAYAEAFASLGAKLVVTYYAPELDDIKKVAAKYNVPLLLIKADLTKEADAENLVQQTLKEFKRIDILVNNAGTILRSPLLEYPNDYWNKVMNININAVWVLSQKVARVMVEQRSGKIINIASMLSYQGGKFVPAYTASKHAVAGLTKAFANELAQYNVQCNAIAPGYIVTANTKDIRADEARNKEILSRIPAGHWGETHELMGVVAFLASKASDYVNGSIIPVDGGWLAR
ncbi:2-dehydro-3-deoxy-D-gluconate 5-dehydrogenase KduD [[Mycoplasma] testudinis]|uniref:2-dehydro-3-deoxy-D-gluconate 5-dehydrogenase KduD n=1 Tax=[Mycoplasma] testudinis TaxID=33924 RepID=UPI000563B3D5|nr:2-dehydro-3-deoxy-D-gluconate 5-dehydrogenase KduD [[Mycoplasma] testudinis]